jgi:hypothetical protein
LAVKVVSLDCEKELQELDIIIPSTSTERSSSKAPEPMGYATGHSPGHAKCRMNLDEVVVKIVKAVTAACFATAPRPLGPPSPWSAALPVSNFTLSPSRPAFGPSHG